MDNWLRFVLAVLAVWRVTHLLVYEDGPWAAVARVRTALGSGWAGRLMDCFKCLSLWVALPFAFVVDADLTMRVVTWLALSGAAIIVDESVAEPLIIEGGERDGLLRGSPDPDGDGWR